MRLRDMLRGGKFVTLHGYNGAIVNITDEDIADPSSLLVGIASAGLAIKVASSSAADTSAGTGAQKVTLYGLDANGAWQEEQITLNGQTTVASTKTWGLANGLPVFGAEVTAVGTGKLNAGTIDVADNAVTFTAGVSQDLTKTYARIPVGANASQNAFFMVPKNERYCVKYFNVSNRAQIVDYKFRILDAATGVEITKTLSLQPATSPYQEISFPDGALILNAGDQIRVMGSAQTTGGVGAVILLLQKMQMAVGL